MPYTLPVKIKISEPSETIRIRQMSEPTPFEKFEELTKKVVRVPKKEVVKLEQKCKAKNKTKKQKPKK